MHQNLCKHICQTVSRSHFSCQGVISMIFGTLSYGHITRKFQNKALQPCDGPDSLCRRSLGLGLWRSTALGWPHRKETMDFLEYNAETWLHQPFFDKPKLWNGLFGLIAQHLMMVSILLIIIVLNDVQYTHIHTHTLKLF